MVIGKLMIISMQKKEILIFVAIINVLKRYVSYLKISCLIYRLAASGALQACIADWRCSTCTAIDWLAGDTGKRGRDARLHVPIIRLLRTWHSPKRIPTRSTIPKASRPSCLLRALLVHPLKITFTVIVCMASSRCAYSCIGVL